MGIQLKILPVKGHEKVIEVTDPSTGLHAIIAIHQTALGPALGGTRIYPYVSLDEALTDVLRLSEGMTYKSAVAGAGVGGGKSVIIADPKTQKTPELLRAFGEAVNRLGGWYVCAEDVGCTLDDCMIIREVTPYVCGLSHKNGGGNPSPYTAKGVFRGIEASLYQLDGSSSVQGKTIAIQGMGSVGSALADYLFWEGANLIISDIDMKKAHSLAHRYQAQVVAPSEILFAPCDVLAPCALGGILDEKTIPKLRCRAVAGGSNNQLLRPEHARFLKLRKILYAPDFVINAGGLINVICELSPEGYNAGNARHKVDEIYHQLLTIYRIAEQNNTSTHEAAIALADYRLRYRIGKKREQLCFA